MHKTIVAASLDSAAVPPADPLTLDLLCFSHLRWHFVTQRPQHLLTRAARSGRVFYWEEVVWHHEANELERRADGGPGMHLEVLQEGPALWVIRPHLTWGIDFEAGQRVLVAEFLASFCVEKFLLWYYTPMALGFTEQLKPQVTVYDCMDELSAFAGAPPQIVERERKLLDNADVVFTGGISLYETKRRLHANVHAFPSSIDAEHFAQAAALQGGPDPADQADIAHPRAGFYGVIDERFDVNLIAKVAALRPAVQFVMIGPVVKIDPAVLPQAENIHYLEGKSYQQLPAYLAGWDVALLPFAMNEATRYISPTKTPEYLAAGRPVVSTPVRDVVRNYGDAGLVAIAETPEAFAEAIDAALQPASAKWKEAIARKLAESSWDSTWAGMQREIQSLLASRENAGDSMRSSASLKTSQTVPVTPLLRPNAFPLLPTSMHRPDAGSFDYVVVGAGFAGSVLAERLASQSGQQVLLIDKREHIAGNAYDFRNEHGILVHKYGPHIFHTNSEKVVEYLSNFTQWRSYEHRVLAHVDGQLLPVPINLDTVNTLYGLNLDADGMKAFLAERVVQPRRVCTSEDIVVSRVGRELYEKFFRNYTRKQWGMDPSELDASVAGRIPVRFDRDDRYFSDDYQLMPLDGYTRMFERMVDHPNITVQTGVDYNEIARSYPKTRIIYTGCIDEYYDFRFGALPYRSLEFRHETHDCETFQAAPVINYPNEHEYTRVTEFKYLTGQKHAKTSIVYEYPQASGDPYYPIPRPENAVVYARYQQLAAADRRVTFCGRLANYKYLNMDQVVAQALSTFRRIAEVAAPITQVRVQAAANKVAALSEWDRPQG